MDITLVKARPEDAQLLHGMQVKAFKPLLERYQDHGTSPANESVDRIMDRIMQPNSDYYIIINELEPIGGIRIVRKENASCRISPVYILPEHQGKGIAHKGSCHGICMKRWGMRVINSSMTIVRYEKRIQ